MWVKGTPGELNPYMSVEALYPGITRASAATRSLLQQRQAAVFLQYENNQ